MQKVIKRDSLKNKREPERSLFDFANRKGENRNLSISWLAFGQIGFILIFPPFLRDLLFGSDSGLQVSIKSARNRRESFFGRFAVQVSNWHLTKSRALSNLQEDSSWNFRSWKTFVLPSGSLNSDCKFTILLKFAVRSQRSYLLEDLAILRVETSQRDLFSRSRS